MRGSAMTLTFTALLCLGLCWGPWDQGQPEVPPKPSIQADPGLTVAQGSPVTIWCQGSLLADVYHLYKQRSSVYWEAKAPQDSRNKARFHFESLSSSDAGQYQCAYQSRNGWSERSDPLPLVVTGLYRAPSLSARPGASVPRGENVTLQCRSEVRSDTFHLSKEGSLAPPQHLHLQDTAPPVQANFTLSAVTSAHSGTYRCYSAHSTAPYLLSLPSDPLELLVSDYTVQNLIRMGLAASVLLLLGVLLCQARHDRGGARDAARS